MGVIHLGILKRELFKKSNKIQIGILGLVTSPTLSIGIFVRNIRYRMFLKYTGTKFRESWYELILSLRGLKYSYLLSDTKFNSKFKTRSSHRFRIFIDPKMSIMNIKHLSLTKCGFVKPQNLMTSNSISNLCL